jgi:lysophospholipase
MTAVHSAPDLEDRFLEPAGWRWGEFVSSQGITIRFGCAVPPDCGVVVVILPGRAEFIEKYFETASGFMAHGCAVCVIDWAGQGGSARIRPDQRGDAPDFALLADDLHALLEEHLPRELKALPKIMLAHSMGANIGLRFLKLFPEVFVGAVLCAPMLGLQAVRMPMGTAILLCKILSLAAGNAYAFGEKDWDAREREKSDAFSSDPARAAVHDAWFAARPELRIGGVSFNWLYHGLRSCAAIQKPSFARSIQTPCLIALAGKEKIVDNSATRNFVSRLKQTQILELPGAAHEILMERDEMREKFLASFYDFIEQCIEKRK